MHHQSFKHIIDFCVTESMFSVAETFATRSLDFRRQHLTLSGQNMMIPLAVRAPCCRCFVWSDGCDFPFQPTWVQRIFLLSDCIMRIKSLLIFTFVQTYRILHHEVAFTCISYAGSDCLRHPPRKSRQACGPPGT
jgi:hypothetical protein